MKVLLTVPMNRPPKISFSLNDNGLGYIAAACEGVGAQVKLFSWNINFSIEKYREQLINYNPAVVGMKVFTTHFKEAYETLRAVRTVLPNTITVIGGPHPSTSTPEHLFLEFNGLIDFAMAGDGEIGIRELIKLLQSYDGKLPIDSLRAVPGLIYQDGNRVISNKKHFPGKLDKLSEQDWSIQAPEWFHHQLNPGLKKSEIQLCEDNGLKRDASKNSNASPSVLLLDSRGCTARCGHCMAWLINGPKPRLRSTESVFREINLLIEKYDVETLEFTGNSFFADVDFVRKICEWLIRKGTPIRWGCTGAAYDRNISSDLLALMFKAGCQTIHFGIEAGSPAVNNRINKPLNLDEYAEIVKKTSISGIKAIGYFMFGFPDETVNEMNETIKYAMALPFDKVEFCICLPLPGTSSYRAILKREGIDRIDWSSYDFSNPAYLPCSATAGQVKRVLLKTKFLKRFSILRRLYRVIHKRSQ